MKTAICLCFLFVLTTFLQESNALRARRQGWTWGGGNGDTTRPTPATNRPSSVTPAGPSGSSTTTTTASSNFRACFEGCPSLPQYNPVCGSNGQTYMNESKLRCARECGLSVDVVRMGTCTPL